MSCIQKKEGVEHICSEILFPPPFTHRNWEKNLLQYGILIKENPFLSVDEKEGVQNFDKYAHF